MYIIILVLFLDKMIIPYIDRMSGNESHYPILIEVNIDYIQLIFYLTNHRQDFFLRII